MPLFSSSSPFDGDVEKATDEMATEENWALILDICDRAKRSSLASKDCLRAIMKRLSHRVPHVAMQTLTLLNACVKNSGQTFLLEVASRDFVAECKNLLADKLHPKVSQKLKFLIKSWAENEFKSDPALALIPSFYNALKSEGHTFVTDDIPKSRVVISKDPNVVSSQEEEDDIAKAIALSLKDAEKSSSKSQSSGSGSALYPSVATSTNSSQMQKGREPRKVRALYDFEAVEDNELTFKAGEMIGILDDSDANWWKGVSWRGEGLFPANFVTSDLSSDDVVENEPVVTNVKNPEPVMNQLHIDEEKIDQTLIMLQNADPTLETCPDPPELVVYEEECKCMQPLIDQELERIDRLHSGLTEINGQLIAALQMYHNLMCEQPAFGGAPTVAMAAAQMPQSSMMMSSQQASLPVTASFQRPSTHVTLEQMLNSQPHMSVGQIPQGIPAQVGPQATPQTTAQSQPYQYQYVNSHVTATAQSVPATVPYGSMPPHPFEYGNLQSHGGPVGGSFQHLPAQPVFSGSVQQQPMM